MHECVDYIRDVDKAAFGATHTHIHTCSSCGACRQRVHLDATSRYTGLLPAAAVVTVIPSILSRGLTYRDRLRVLEMYIHGEQDHCRTKQKLEAIDTKTEYRLLRLEQYTIIKVFN